MINKYDNFLNNSRVDRLNRGGSSLTYIATLRDGIVSPYKRQDHTEIRKILIKEIIIDEIEGNLYYYDSTDSNRSSIRKDIEGTDRETFLKEIQIQTIFSQDDMPIAPTILYSDIRKATDRYVILPVFFTKDGKTIPKTSLTCDIGIIVMEYFENAQTTNDVFSHLIRVPCGEVLDSTYIIAVLNRSKPKLRNELLQMLARGHII
jgi:hypothetical protein